MTYYLPYFRTFLMAICLMILAHFTACNPADEYDLLIKNGLVYDGSDKPGIVQDLGIRGEKIVARGDLSASKGKRIIDAEALAVAPGFIDMHAHLEPLMRMPGAGSHVRQGVTTALGGPDGGGVWPLGAYLDTVAQIGVGMNVAYLCGHNVIRREVMGMENRAPTDAELQEMKSHVETAMKEGAFGISTGLKYLPGAFSKVDEVIALSAVAAQNGGFYTSHLREEGLGLIDGVQEAILIGREAKIPIVLTHHKVVGKPMWGSSERTLFLVDSAREAGIDVRVDQYPYTASFTSISILIPAWAQADGPRAFAERVKNPALRDSIHAGIVFNLINDRGGADLKRVQFSGVSWNKDLEGKTLHDWATMKELEPTMETGADLVIEAQVNGGARVIFFAMDQGDVDRIMLHPQTMIASDGRLTQQGYGMPHPRNYGTFPRVLGHYVRERKLMPLETAIRKMTGLPADRLGVKDRGYIAEGMFADLVIFDPETIMDQATFEEPHQYSTGIQYVFVNGVAAVDEGAYMNTRSGKVLRRQ